MGLEGIVSKRLNAPYRSGPYAARIVLNDRMGPIGQALDAVCGVARHAILTHLFVQIFGGVRRSFLIHVCSW
jgi:hypothetical protein